MKNICWFGMCVIAFMLMPSKTESDLGKLVLFHELDKTGNIIRSIALSDGMFELMTATIAAMVFFGIISWVMGGEKI